MIVVDSSALIAIFEYESDAADYAAAICVADRLLISAVSVHETGTVLRIRRGMQAVDQMWDFLTVANNFEIVPFGGELAKQAIMAFDRYGKGINPRSRLNLADCAVYALAKASGSPLLFKGKDFSATDLQSCL